LAINDREALLAALQAMGYQGKIEIHERPVVLVGYDGAPRELDGRAVTAEIVIRRQHLWAAANDIGFARQSDGTYLAYISEYDRRVQPTWHTRVLQEYGGAKAAKELRRQGWKVDVVRDQATGRLCIQGVRYA